MATKQDLEIRAGRTYTVTVNVSGVDDWSDKSAVMSIGGTFDNDPDYSINGTTDNENDIIEFDLTATQTAEMQGLINYEVTVYTDDRSYVKDIVYGTLTVRNTLDHDPTD